MKDLKKAEDLRVRLISWYADNARPLPWRETHDPYLIWISEIMLQQTQVATVIPYYLKFSKRFPTIKRLAEASLEEVLALWSGLGYYKRARQVKQSAEQIIKGFDGLIPRVHKDLLSLPGIGKYPAGAILSIAYDLNYPILDGNVMRVLSRVFAMDEVLNAKGVQNKLWSLAEKILPEKKAGMFNQALMELGALICLPSGKKSLCHDCPISESCEAHQKDLVSQLPKLPEKREKVKIQQVMFLLLEKKGFLILQRPDDVLLKGMWELPGKEISDQPHQEAAYQILKEDFAVDGNPHYLSSLSHSITYRAITCHVYLIHVSGEVKKSLMNRLESRTLEYRWIQRDELQDLPHSSLIDKVMLLLDPVQKDLF